MRTRADRPDVSVVVMSRNRRHRVLDTLPRLTTASRRRLEIVLVDNGSSDGTADAVRALRPDVTVIALPDNRGAPARNVGAQAAGAGVVAFADDDSWWAPGALDRAVELFDRYPRLAVLAARILVGPEQRLDPTSALMSGSPLARAADLPGPSVLGFVACGSVVRRSAFLGVGGFDSVVHFGGEEERVAIDLAAGGWGLAYAAEVVAHHHPASGGGNGRARQRLVTRNAILTACMRRPWSVVAARVAAAPHPARLATLPRMPAALARRRRIPPLVEAQLRLLDRPPGPGAAA